MGEIKEIELDDARSWTVKDSLEFAIGLLEKSNYTQCVVILRDQRERQTEIVRSGVDDMQSLGLMSYAAHISMNGMIPD